MWLKLNGFFLVLLILSGACSNDEPGKKTATLSPDDRTKFIGRWAGSYRCPRMFGHPDTLIVAPGDGALDFRITIHASVMNPDIVTGHLISSKEVIVTGQLLGGESGTARLTLRGDTLSFEQTGLGVTCSGDDYTLY